MEREKKMDFPVEFEPGSLESFQTPNHQQPLPLKLRQDIVARIHQKLTINHFDFRQSRSILASKDPLKGALTCVPKRISVRRLWSRFDFSEAKYFFKSKTLTIKVVSPRAAQLASDF